MIHETMLETLAIEATVETTLEPVRMKNNKREERFKCVQNISCMIEVSTLIG